MRDRDIPTFLAHLRRDRRGLPVPYINQWGAEDINRYRVAYDRNVGAVAVFLDDDPDGEPDFTKQNMARQRESTMQGLCQVCGRPVPWSRRFLAVADISVSSAGQFGEAVTEPWLDERRGRFAVDHCPALIRRYHAGKLHIVPVTSKRQVRIVISTGWLEGPLEQQTKAHPPVMWAKIQLLAVPRLPTVVHAAMGAR